MEFRFNSFTNLISSIYHSIYVIKDEETQEFGLKSTHVSVIYNIHKYNGLSQVELCGVCGENKAAISRTVANLCEGEYIYPSDDGMKYKKKYLLTEKGKSVAVLVDKKIERYIQQASGEISDDDRENMYRCLEIIDKNLKKNK